MQLTPVFPHIATSVDAQPTLPGSSVPGVPGNSISRILQRRAGGKIRSQRGLSFATGC